VGFRCARAASCNRLRFGVEVLRGRETQRFGIQGLCVFEPLPASV